MGILFKFVISPVIAAIIGRGVLGAFHYYGWFPDRLVTHMLTTSPEIYQIYQSEIVWITSAVFGAVLVVIWHLFRLGPRLAVWGRSLSSGGGYTVPPLEPSIVFDGSELFNDISSPRKYGEQLLCRIYRIGVENKTNTTLRNVRVIVKNMIHATTGQIIPHFIGDPLGATNREGISFNLAPGTMERFDVLYAKDSTVQHGPEFDFTIDDNQLALCIPNKKPNAALFKEPYDITLQAQADDTSAVSRRFVTAIDDQGNVLFKPVDE